MVLCVDVPDCRRWLTAFLLTLQYRLSQLDRGSCAGAVWDFIAGPPASGDSRLRGWGAGEALRWRSATAVWSNLLWTAAPRLVWLGFALVADGIGEIKRIYVPKAALGAGHGA